MNNTIYNRYAETGRIEWASKYAKYIDPTHAEEWRSLWVPVKEGLLLRKITTEYKFVGGYARSAEDGNMLTELFSP